MITNTPEPVLFWDGRGRICTQKEKDWDERTGGTRTLPCGIPLYGTDILAALQAERERAERYRDERDTTQRVCRQDVEHNANRAEKAEAELAALKEALRNPTPEMIEAGAKVAARFIGSAKDSALHLFYAMTAHLLKD